MSNRVQLPPPPFDSAATRPRSWQALSWAAESNALSGAKRVEGHPLLTSANREAHGKPCLSWAAESNALSERSESKGTPYSPPRTARFAHGKSPVMDGRVECPERAKRVEGHPFLYNHPTNGRHRRCHRSRVRYVYILRCADDSLYIGETDNLDLRVARHNAGRGCQFTATRRPVVLMYSEAYSSREASMKREGQIKKWTRAKKEALIAGDLERLKAL